MQFSNMASRLFLLAAIVLFCIALVLKMLMRKQCVNLCFCSSEQASSDAKIENQDTQRGQEVKGANRRLFTSVDCVGLCRVRCSLHSRPNVCTRACGTCCARCNCVPPGTSGNREICGRCYTDMTTHGNKTKCP